MLPMLLVSMAVGAEPDAMEMEKARAAVAAAIQKTRTLDSVKASPRLTGSVIQAMYRRPVGHTHTCANGHTFDHKDGANKDHVCPHCGVVVTETDPRPRMVKETVPGLEAVTTEGPVTYQRVLTATITPQSIGSACANGSCAMPTRNVSGGWYLGKNLGRK